MEDWVSVKERAPNSKELRRSSGHNFLCAVLIPDEGGYFKKEYRVLTYMGDRWNCTGMIVTHFQELPDLPKNFLLSGNEMPDHIW